MSLTLPGSFNVLAFGVGYVFFGAGYNEMFLKLRSLMYTEHRKQLIPMTLRNPNEKPSHGIRI